MQGYVIIASSIFVNKLLLQYTQCKKSCPMLMLWSFARICHTNQTCISADGWTQYSDSARPCTAVLQCRSGLLQPLLQVQVSFIIINGLILYSFFTYSPFLHIQVGLIVIKEVVIIINGLILLLYPSYKLKWVSYH